MSQLSESVLLMVKKASLKFWHYMLWHLGLSFVLFSNGYLADSVVSTVVSTALIFSYVYCLLGMSSTGYSHKQNLLYSGPI